MKRISFIVPLLMAVALGGCSIPFLSKSVEQVKQTAEEKVAQQEILKNCKYDKAICEYMAAQISIFSSGVTMTSSTIKNGVVSDTSVTKMDGKGNMESVSTEKGKETSAMIAIDKATYIKDYEDGKWMKMTSGETKEDTSLFNVPTTTEEIKKSIESTDIEMVYTKVGQEACGSMAPGLTCDIYEMYEKSLEGGKTKMWIDTSKHLSRKMEMTLPDKVISSIVYTYGPVTITTPSPVKEFTMPTIPSGASGTAPSQADIEKMMQDLPDYGQDTPADSSGE